MNAGKVIVISYDVRGALTETIDMDPGGVLKSFLLFMGRSRPLCSFGHRVYMGAIVTVLYKNQTRILPLEHVIGPFSA